ncbi:MAG: 50S ribosomal protein L6 [Candidatus Hadarchaeales archaeon]
MIRDVVKIPEGIQVKIEGNTVEVSGKKGSIKKTFGFPEVVIKQGNGTVVIEAPSPKRKLKAAVGTIKAHLRNMIKGVTDGYTYKLRIVYSHFPIKVEVKGNKVLIHNFLGEKYPRVAEILEGVTVRVEGDEIIVSGIDKEAVGQTAANIEQATVVRYRDRRIFQDGCYITEKG